MDGLGSAASVIAVVDLAAKVVSLLFQYSTEVKDAKEDIARVQLQLQSLKTACESVQKRLQGPDGVKLEASHKLINALHDGCSQLRSLEQRLDPGKRRKAMSRFGIRALKWPFDSKEIEKTTEHLSKCTQSISLALQADQLTILLAVDQKMVLDKLAAADGAAFDSYAEGTAPTCHSDTRVDLLRQIREWADQPDVHAIFWLNGMAGTGKSTISRTVARRFADDRRLGASFFFKRGDGDRGKVAKFFTTIAAQLVSAVPAVAVYIKNAIESDPTVITKAIREQFEKLVLEPLSKITPDALQASSLVIVVDALDECERDEDVKLIIDLFSRARSLTSLRLRILVTSRPELPIRLGFRAIDGQYQDLILHDIPKPVIAHDISAYLRFELARIRHEYNASHEECQLAFDWPGQSTIQILVDMAAPLFIFAATVCRFVEDQRALGNPDKKLKRFLEYGTKSQLDNMYLPVLEQRLTVLCGHEEAELINQFRDVVGPIIILASPLSARSLAKMLDLPIDTIFDILDWLHSVLSIPSVSGSPIRLLHLSFRDFLLDPKKQETNLFWIDEQQTHKRLAAHCLRVMRVCLRTDICGLQAPATPRQAINPEIIEASLPPEVQYACLYWVYHVEGGKIQPSDGDEVYDFLCQHFLQWLEALSIIGRASESISILRKLQSLVQVNTQLYDFLTDAIRLVLANTLIVDSVPLQLYSSVLAFTPQTSKVRQKFKDIISSWISLQPEPETNWSQCLQILEGHSGSVSSVAFSHDSALIASASYDKTVRVWRSDTGECIQELKGHSGWIRSVAFSHDSALIASASYDKTVRVWRSDTGECVHEINMGASVTLLYFNADSSHLLTSLGAISMPQMPAATELTESYRFGYGFSRDRYWITWHGYNLLWLPAEFRPGESAVSGHTVVIGCNSGRVIIIRFNTEAVMSMFARHEHA